MDGRYLAPLTIEKVTAEDLDVDDNHILMVENSNGRSEFLITIRSDLFLNYQAIICIYNIFEI